MLKKYDVLTWLKKHNLLYTQIQLPDSHKNLIIEELYSEYQFNDAVSHTALLTQIKDPDTYYEQFTIYPMYEKRINKSSTALYQMLKVQDIPMDNRQNFRLVMFSRFVPIW